MAKDYDIVQLAKASLEKDNARVMQLIDAIIVNSKRSSKIGLSERLENLKKSYENKRTMSSTPVASPLNKLGVGKIFEQEQPTIGSLSNLTLKDEVLSTLLSLQKEYLNREKLEIRGIYPRNRVLLTGPPGNGKTSIANALSGLYNIPILSIKLEGIINSYLGASLTNLSNAFAHAACEPCVLFLDELESICSERSSSNDVGEAARLTATLLLKIDRLPNHVILVAATNHPEMLDRAVQRRFQVKINLENPSIEMIRFFIVEFKRKYNMEFEGEEVELEGKLLGLSFSEIEQFCLSELRNQILS